MSTAFTTTYTTALAIRSKPRILTSRVFHRALNHINHYHNRGVPFSAWLYRIAHNLVANWHRDNSRRNEVPLDDQPNLFHQGEQPERALVTNQELENLLKVIRKLPAERQQLLILKFVEGMSNAEIAQIMMRSEGAIKSLYHRTLLTLRDEITGSGTLIRIARDAANCHRWCHRHARRLGVRIPDRRAAATSEFW